MEPQLIKSWGSSISAAFIFTAFTVHPEEISLVVISASISLFLAPCCVAAGAVLEAGYPFFSVFAFDPIG